MCKRIEPAGWVTSCGSYNSSLSPVRRGEGRVGRGWILPSSAPSPLARDHLFGARSAAGRLADVPIVQRVRRRATWHPHGTPVWINPKGTWKSAPIHRAPSMMMSITLGRRPHSEIGHSSTVSSPPPNQSEWLPRRSETWDSRRPFAGDRQVILR